MALIETNSSEFDPEAHVSLCDGVLTTRKKATVESLEKLIDSGDLALARTLMVDWGGGSRITRLPANIGKLQLEAAYIAQKVVVGPELWTCTSLRKLELARLDDQDLTGLGALTQLRRLVIAACKFKSLPEDDIAALQALEELEIGGFGASLTALPASLGKLSKLKVLDLRHAKKLKKLPSLAGATALEKLLLEESAVTALPPELIARTNVTISPAALAGR